MVAHVSGSKMVQPRSPISERGFGVAVARGRERAPDLVSVPLPIMARQRNHAPIPALRVTVLVRPLKEAVVARYLPDGAVNAYWG